MDKTLELTYQTIIIYVVVFIYARLLGKKQMSQLTYFNYITGIVLGSMTANAVFNPSIKYYQGLAIITIWCLLTGITGVLHLKVNALKPILSGHETILIKNGKIVRKALEKERLTINEIKMMLRNQKIFSIKEIDYAILEPNGKLSVLKNMINQNTTKNDLNKNVQNSEYLPMEIIINGHIIKRNLQTLNITEQFVLDYLNKIGITSIKNVLYAEMQENGDIIVDQ